MREMSVTVPEIMLIAGIRTAIGVGVGLLIAEKLNREARKGAGWALLVVGAVASIPIAIGLIGKGHVSRIEMAPEKRAA